MKTAVCKCCLIEKDAEQFPARNDRSGRLRPYCYECARNSQRARYVAHKRDNPFKHKYTRTRSRAQGLKVAFDLTPEYLASIWTGKCPVLGVEIFMHEKDRSDEFAAELDRFIPSHGYVKGNVTFLSRRANRLKNSASVTELSQLIKWMKKYENKSNVSKAG